MTNIRHHTAPKPSLNKLGVSSSYGQEPQRLYGLQRSKLIDNQNQKIVQDQHYSNNIMMTALSTLESLEGASRNNRLKR
jgi:hypothetical protein